jgi:hypothetical protein
MSFDPVKYLDDPPKFNPNRPEQFEGHYRDMTDFIRNFFNKQRELGLGVQYDTQDRVEVPIWFLWMYT